MWTKIISESRTPKQTVVVEKHDTLSGSSPWVVRCLTIKTFSSEESCLEYVGANYPRAVWELGERPSRNVAREIVDGIKKDFL